VSYKSIDTFCDATKAVNYPTGFLNLLDLPSKLPHNLQMKVGSPVILLRNLNPPRRAGYRRRQRRRKPTEAKFIFI
jgi:hypothetical protein